jgi:hypothetical protein
LKSFSITLAFNDQSTKVAIKGIAREQPASPDAAGPPGFMHDGQADTFEAAKAKIEQNWRVWLAAAGLSEHPYRRSNSIRRSRFLAGTNGRFARLRVLMRLRAGRQRSRGTRQEARKVGHLLYTEISPPLAVNMNGA